MNESTPVPNLEKGMFQTREVIPAAYDSRNVLGKRYVTPVKDQDSLGICWSYATIAAVESSLLAHGQVASPNALDLSERQLAYFSYNLVSDPIGNTAGDRNIPTNPSISYETGKRINNYIENAGNAWLTTEVLSSGIGVVNESVAPSRYLIDEWNNAWWDFSTSFQKKTNLNPNLARGSNVWTLSQAKRISMLDRDSVKSAIRKYGGVAVLTYLEIYGRYYYKGISYNENNAAYYNRGMGDDSNHLITIIGWDDNYDKNNFRDDYVPFRIPKNNGAWLCKNSWGNYFGNGGYYWISYEDAYFNRSDPKGENLEKGMVAAYAYEMRPASAREGLYQHDGSASTCYKTMPSGGSIANMYKVSAVEGRNEVLEKVCLTLMNDADVNYSIQVYTDCTSANNPTSGKAAFITPQKGKTDHAGFYTIDLNKKVTLKYGSKFAVVVTLSHDNPNQKVNYDVDSSGDYYSFIKFQSAAESNESFVRNSSSVGWSDLSKLKCDCDLRYEDGHQSPSYTNCVARIKAITRTEATPKPITPSGKVTIRNTIANSAKRTNDVIWDKSKVANATHYEVQWRKRGTTSWVGQWKTKTVGNTIRATTTGLDIKGLYEIRVRPKRQINAGGKTYTALGTWSSSVYRYFHTTEKIRLASRSKGSFTMSWKNNPQATSYQVMYTTNKNGAGAAKNIHTVGKGKTSFTKAGLKSGVTYYVQVREIRKVNGINYIGNISIPVAVRVR